MGRASATAAARRSLLSLRLTAAVSCRQLRDDAAARTSQFGCLRRAQDRLRGELPGAVSNDMLGRRRCGYGSGLRRPDWWDYPDRRQAREAWAVGPLY
jgi:hypothetical protein